MRLPWSRRFREEATLLRLQWTCESCAHFTGEDRCAHDFPTEKHRAARYAGHAETGPDIFFCKEHELA